MPLVRVDKARRRKRPKPEWQDTRPVDEEQRETWDVAREHQERFARNFTLAAGALATPAVLRAVRSKAPGDTAGMVGAVPFLGSGLKEAEEVWRPMRERFEVLLESAISAEGQAEFARIGFPAAFTAQNPFSQEFIRGRAARLTADISSSSGRALQAALDRGVATGLHPRSLAQLVEGNIGLAEREANAVMHFFDRRLAEGFTSADALTSSKAYGLRLRRQRALRIARTETITSQNRGRLDAWRLAEEAGALPPEVKKKWIAALGSPRTCEICMELASMEPIPVNESWDSSFVGAVQHPGEESHPNCLPGDVLVSCESPVAATRRWFDGDVLTIETASGNQVTCTPNHPILTRRGWIPARLLHIGCEVISHSLDERGMVVDVNHDHVPTSIHEMTESLRRSGEMTAAEVPAAPENFHGDGFGGDVTVVRPDRFLIPDLDSAVLEPTAELELQGGGPGFPVVLDPARAAQSVLDALLFASNSVVARTRMLSSFLRRHVCHANVHCLAAVAGFDFAILESLSNHLPAHTESFRDRFFRFASEIGFFDGDVVEDMYFGPNDAKLKESVADDTVSNADFPGDLRNRFPAQVSFDRVVEVKHQSYSGHVYNLQTESGAYVAQGIYVHNCRCTIILARP
jgi:hypothetical protein